MAATLVLSDNAKGLVANSLKQDLSHVFLGKLDGSVNLEATLTNPNIQSLSSDNSARIKQLRFDQFDTDEYKAINDLIQNDESRIMNFYLRNGTAVNKLVLMNSSNVVKGIITFPTITPTETKSLYVPQIKINVL